MSLKKWRMLAVSNECHLWGFQFRFQGMIYWGIIVLLPRLWSTGQSWSTKPSIHPNYSSAAHSWWLRPTLSKGPWEPYTGAASIPWCDPSRVSDTLQCKLDKSAFNFVTFIKQFSAELNNITCAWKLDQIYFPKKKSFYFSSILSPLNHANSPTHPRT